MGVLLSAFFADIGCKLFHNARRLWLSTAPAIKTSAVFRFANSLFVLISLDALVIFVCIFYGLRADLCLRVENLHIKESAIKSGAPQTLCFVVHSSVIINSGGITRENCSIDRLRFWFYLDIAANVIHQVCKHVSDFIFS